VGVGQLFESVGFHQHHLCYFAGRQASTRGVSDIRDKSVNFLTTPYDNLTSIDYLNQQ